MTTQLALLNMSGLAIASDTLATLTSAGAFKTSQGNSKIWTPSGNHKFAVFHSGSSHINSMPHQLHIDAWFSTLTTPLATLKDYVESYKRFSSSKNSPHSRDSEPELVKSLLREFIQSSKKTINQKSDLDPETPEGEVQWLGLVHDEAKFVNDAYKELKALPNTTPTWANETITKFKINLRKEIKEYFYEGIAPKSVTLFSNAFKKFLQTGEPSPITSTLTFVGFGAKEVFPSSLRYDVRGIINGMFQLEQTQQYTIDGLNRSLAIVYGAQCDAMWAMVQGYRSPVERHLRNILDVELGEHENKQAITDQVVQGLQNITGQEYVNPAFRRLTNHSLSELAQTTKDMVNLQILSAKLSGSSETVGGDVEVLTIDKINGIRWQNRI